MGVDGAKPLNNRIAAYIVIVGTLGTFFAAVEY
jgi:hypothetical protein